MAFTKMITIICGIHLSFQWKELMSFLVLYITVGIVLTALNALVVMSVLTVIIVLGVTTVRDVNIVSICLILPIVTTDKTVTKGKVR